MAPFCGILAGFIAGVLLTSITTSVQRQLITIPALNKLRDTISTRGFRPICYDIYANWPLTLARNIADMATSPNPIPGLIHLTITGRTHTGMRNLEMWYETVAPGGATPIHTHDCEEVFLVLSGTGGAMKIQALDGRVITQNLPAMSTITVLPNARHQFVNTGDDGVTFVVAFDNAPMRATAFPTWEAKQGHLMGPLPWDGQCPEKNPEIGDLVNNDGGLKEKKSEL